MLVKEFKHPDDEQVRQWWFICPGCGTAHAIQGTADQYNGDPDKPTIDMAIGTIYNKKTDRQCWVTEIRNGRVYYHKYTEHQYAGGSAAMVPIEDNDG